MSLNDDLFEASIRHQMYLQRHASGVVNSSLKLLEEMESRIVSELQRGDLTKLNIARLEKKIERIRTIIKRGYKPALAKIRAETDELAVYESGFQANTLAKAIPQAVPLSADFITPAPKQVLAAVKSKPFSGRYLRDWYRELEPAAFKRVRDTVRQGFADGETTESIVNRIAGTRSENYEDGILQQNRRHARTAVRTALNHTSNTAREYTYEENSDILDGVQWVSTLDGRTTLICAGRDGLVYKVDKGPRPPAHPGCRSTTAPVVKSWKKLGIKLGEAPEGTRESFDGQVAAKTTYDAFLRKQTPEFQDDFLGKKAGILFRKGKLDIRKFTDRRGNALTLDQLREREPEAWAKSGLD